MAPARVLVEAPTETIPEQGLNRGQGRVGARIGQASARLGRAGRPRMHPLGNLEVVGSKEVPCRKPEKEPRTPA
nr:hypothetical protein Itr_chr01CG07230 [Ipomoea trifida]